MSLTLFLQLLLIVSVVTGLLTEAIKKQLDELGKKYYSNLLAGIVAIFVGLFICIGYTILVGLTVTASIIVIYIALVILSWVAAMVGYDKVVQAIGQIKGK